MNKQRIALSAALLLSTASPATAQLELTPMLGWSFGGSFRDAYYGDISNPVTNLDVANEAHYGLALGITTSEQTGVELLYLRQDTHLDYESSFDVATPSFDVAINYFHGGFRFMQPYGDWGVAPAGEMGGKLHRLEPVDLVRSCYRVLLRVCLEHRDVAG